MFLELRYITNSKQGSIGYVDINSVKDLIELRHKENHDLILSLNEYNSPIITIDYRKEK